MTPFSPQNIPLIIPLQQFLEWLIYELNLGTSRLENYCVCCLMGSRIIESAAYCNQILLAQIRTVHKTSRLIELFGYCYRFYVVQDPIKRRTMYWARCIQYRWTSLYAVFLSANSRICNCKLTIFLECIPQFTLILGLLICEFIVCEPNFLVPIYRI
jgi:hypothetical protein